MGKINFCAVGCGDCSVLLAKSGTYLIDCHELQRHAHLLPSSRRLRAVFVTHQHRDHYSGLQYLKESGASIDCLIYSPYERRYNDSSVTYEEWTEFNGLRDYFVARGTKTWAPYRPDSFDKRFWDAGDVSFEILAPFPDLARSPTRELHDACLVIGIYAGRRRFLVTGDACDASLGKLAANTHNYCNDLLRASHHGSIDGADLDFVKKAKAEWTVISTQSGVHDNVPHPTALARYRENTKQRVFRTDVDGPISAEF